MILIFSTEDWERSTEDVMDWIRALGGDCARYNGEDLIGEREYSLELSEQGGEVRLDLGGAEITTEDVHVVWYRRGGRFSSFTVHSQVGGHHETSTQLDRHMRSEMASTARSLYALLADAPWLTRPDQASGNKVAALRAAHAVGLDVPATIITNSRAQLEAFHRRCGRIITKAISDGTAFYLGERRYTMYTEEATSEDIAQLPETFLPTLAQEFLEKEYEVRAFYLDGACYPMAIFSQRDPRTAIDFRRYNMVKPNRSVPYRLSAETRERARALMHRLDLPTGSLDFVKTVDGRLVFLEVNPVGQFGMVSKPCNYHIEKRVAEHLLALGANDLGELEDA